MNDGKNKKGDGEKTMSDAPGPGPQAPPPKSDFSAGTRLPYFPGCTLKTAAKNFETSSTAVATSLGIELVEIPRWNCCGTVSSLTSDDLIHHVAPVRDLVRVEGMNDGGELDKEYRLVTLCTMCFHVLKRSHLRVAQNPEELGKINDLMYLEKDYAGKVNVIHFLEVLRDIGFAKIRDKVKKPLAGLKVSPYYGCMLLRPKEVGIDDPEAPTILTSLLEALGADVVDNPLKTRCCGSYQTVRDRYAVAELSYDILRRARAEGAEVLVTSCPLCMFNLADRQKEIVEKHPEFAFMPVLYFTQLAALALGFDESACGFGQNAVDPRPMLNEKNLLR
jgi:heterodisulfide reductase subunit B